MIHEERNASLGRSRALTFRARAESIFSSFGARAGSRDSALNRIIRLRQTALFGDSPTICSFCISSSTFGLLWQSDQAGLYQGACLEIEVTTALGAPELHEFEATAIDRE